MLQSIGYAAKTSYGKLKPFEFERRSPRENEVLITILYCGVCHSDVQQAKNQWHNTIYPCMPGHEIVGKVESFGNKVTKFSLGEIVGVGCMIDSCHECQSCREGLENYCERGFTGTYNGNIRHPTKENNTFGGFSNSIVVREDFILKIPENLPIKEVAPLMCSGVTTYSSLKHWKIGPGSIVGIAGYGGLGHLATKIAKALGARVFVFSSSPEKEADAYKNGADEFICSKDSEQMSAHINSLDFILSTIPEPHDPNIYTALLKRDGVLTFVGCVAPLTKPLDLSHMITDRKSIATSLIGGIAETQEVLNFCSEHNILPVTKLITIDEVNEAFDNLDEGLVDFRYVIDMSTLAGKHEDKSLLEQMLN